MKKLLALLCLLPGLSYGQGLPIGPNYYGGFYTNLFLLNCASGDNDIWTVPAGYRALGLSGLLGTTNTAGSTVYTEVKTNALYLKLTSTSSITTNSSASMSFGAYVYDEGETFAINATTAGVNAWACLRVWPTNINVKSIKFLNPTAAATNLFYTCPANSRAGPVNGSYNGTTLTLNFRNLTSGAVKFSYYLVPAGSPLDSTTRFISVRSEASGNLLGTSVPQLYAGDSIYFDTDSSDVNQFWFMTIEEYPSP